MILNLWNYFRGYVIIKVSGFSVERFINLAIHRGIYIWDLKYLNDGILMKVSLKGFKLLKSCAKKTKCKITIVDKIGRPFFFFKYRKRKLLFIGVTFFIFILYFFSSFVWLIEIEGNQNINCKEFLVFLENKGLKVGTFKYKLNKKYLEKEIVNNFRDISFINIVIKGTKVQIKIKEILPKKEIIDFQTPSNIIAKKDGLILNIFVTGGTPLVKPGDVVKKGDLLVTGELFIKDNESNIRDYVHSIADIRAKIYYNINFDISREFVEKKYTGKVKKKFRLNIMDKDINFFNIRAPYLNYDKNISMNQLTLGNNYPLPFIIIKESYKEFIPVKREYSLKEMKKLANEIITSRIINEFDFDIDVIDKKIIYKENLNGLEVKSIITAIEDIGEIVPVN